MILRYLDLKYVNPHNPKDSIVRKVIVDDVIKINLNEKGLTYWEESGNYYYLPLYRIGDVRIYENDNQED